ncbi:MAG: hypothetical protein JSS82_12600 [Bacteroidetes bacterium]|nr:hypothetical protein [Bacteroidota bacterium]
MSDVALPVDDEDARRHQAVVQFRTICREIRGNGRFFVLLRAMTEEQWGFVDDFYKLRATPEKTRELLDILLVGARSEKRFFTFTVEGYVRTKVQQIREREERRTDPFYGTSLAKKKDPKQEERDRYLKISEDMFDGLKPKTGRR